MSASSSQKSMMKKGNAIAVLVVLVAFIYVWKIESTPKPPLDRTVTTRTGSVSQTPPATPANSVPSKPVATDPVTARGDQPIVESPAPAASGSVNVLEDDNGNASDIPPSSVVTDPVNAGSNTNSGSAQSGSLSYYNNYLDYGLSVPKGSYYAGYGGQDGASHTMGFASGTGVVSFEEAPIKLWYYPNKLLPELGNGENSFYQNPGTNMTYLKLGNGTVRIEGNMEDPIVNSIIQTVHRGD